MGKVTRLTLFTVMTTVVVFGLSTTGVAWAQGEEESPLDAIVVTTATRTAEDLREVTSNITVVTEEQIKASTANTMADLMTQQGFYMQAQGTSKNIFIRGIGSSGWFDMDNRILILINGRRTGYSNLNIIGLANVERVEIIKGPAAVQYGPAAMGGVINVITKKGIDQEFSLDAELGYGSYDLFKQTLSFSGAKNKFDYSFGIENFGRDDYKLSTGEIYDYSAIKYAASTNIDLGYSFNDKHRLGISYTRNDNHAERSFTWYRVQHQEIGDIQYNYYIRTNQAATLAYDGGTSDGKFTWSGQYTYAETTQKTETYNPRNWGPARYDKQFGDQDSENEQFSAQISYNGDLLSLTTGVDHITNNYSNKLDYYNPPKASTYASTDHKDIGGYLNAKLRLFDEKLIFSASGRYDEFTINHNSFVGDDFKKTNFAPSVGLAYLPNEWLKLRAHYSEGFKMPSATNIAGTSNTKPNLGLTPESSQTFEVGVDLTFDYLTAGVTYFQTDYKDKLSVVTIPDTPEGYDRQTVNLEGAAISGFEISVRGDIGPAQGWNFTLSPYANMTILTRRQNKDHTTTGASVKEIGSDVLQLTPKYLLNFGVAFDYPDIDLKTNVNLVYTSKVLAEDHSIDPGRVWNYNDNTTIVDISLEKGLYQWGDGDKNKMKIRAELNNAFNSYNETYHYNPMQGRNYYVGLQFDYN